MLKSTSLSFFMLLVIPAGKFHGVGKHVYQGETYTGNFVAWGPA